MLEVNNKVANKEELENKLNKVIAEKDMPIVEEDGDEFMDDNASKIATIRRDITAVNRQLNLLDSCWALSEDRELNTTKKHFKRTRRFFKRVIRKMTRFLFRPIYEQQSEFNNATVKAITKLNNIVKNLLDEVKDLEDQIKNED